VAFFGHSQVFPLSPFYLEAKLRALQLYSFHRPICLLTGHPPPGELIQNTSRRYGLPSGLLQALLETESGGEPHRISAAGAMGIAQLVPSTAVALGVRDPFDSTASIDAAGRYLASLVKQFGDVRLAVAAYNAGPGNVVGHVVPHNGETEHYVARVMGRYALLGPSQLKADLRFAKRRGR
jgi:soluble lytic murein transglycosylase-like protein